MLPPTEEQQQKMSFKPMKAGWKIADLGGIFSGKGREDLAKRGTVIGRTLH